MSHPFDNPYAEAEAQPVRWRSRLFTASETTSRVPVSYSVRYEYVAPGSYGTFRWSALEETTPPDPQTLAVYTDYREGRISKKHYKRQIRKLRRAQHAASIR